MNAAHPDLNELIRHPDRACRIPLEVIPALLAQLAAVQSVLAALLADAPVKSGVRPFNPEPDTLLTADQAAKILNVTPRWLYRHAKRLPFTRRLSRKVLRFSKAGLLRWQAIKRS